MLTFTQAKTAVRKWYPVVLGSVMVLAALTIVGCGGGGNDTVTPAPSSGWKQVDATYVGRQTCRDCHATIDDEYAAQDMGDNAPTRMAYSAEEPDCGDCHVTGLGEPSGYKKDGSTPHLDGIGCESCHGPGSAHVKSLAAKDITKTPPADKTCWDCHGGHTYKELDQPEHFVTAESQKEEALSVVSRGPHYPPAAFLLGRQGFEISTPVVSPHAALANTCVDCHQQKDSPTHFGKTDHGEFAQVPNTDTSRPACISCHAGSRSKSLVQDGVKATMIKLGGEDVNNPGNPISNGGGGMLGAYKTKYALSATTPVDDPHLIAYKGAMWNYQYVRKDHSNGVHNPPMAKRLLEDAQKLLIESDTD